MKISCWIADCLDCLVHCCSVGWRTNNKHESARQHFKHFVRNHFSRSPNELDFCWRWSLVGRCSMPKWECFSECCLPNTAAVRSINSTPRCWHRTESWPIWPNSCWWFLIVRVIITFVIGFMGHGCHRNWRHPARSSLAQLDIIAWELSLQCRTPDELCKNLK